MLILEATLGNRGKCVSVSSGMCGEIYIFDQGENTHPRYVCAKLPKLLANSSTEETNSRFINELRIQLSFYHHMFVNWAFDFSRVMDTPVALFRYWGSDLEKKIQDVGASTIEKLSIMVYVCCGLEHCYKNGLVSHQDLKPANIFLRRIKDQFTGLPDTDIFTFAIVADFGLANASINSSVFDGSRPYMAPEQWEKTNLTSQTDVFALGVILYELMTGGHHPVGIKLRDYWPEPTIGNTKKWTKPDAWKKWAKNVTIDFNNTPQITPEIKALIKGMLSADSANRPSIREVKLAILEIIRTISEECHIQMWHIINHYNKLKSSEPLEKSWPYLWARWNILQDQFE